MTIAAIPIPNVATMHDLWCVYEHHVPPAIIFVHVCRLTDVFMMREARQNSEWNEIFPHSGALTIHITHIVETQEEAGKIALKRLRSLPMMPRCNLVGYNMRGSTRALECSNGCEYRSQSHAAKALGLSQGNLSRHMRGELAAVRGLKFWYKGSRDDD